MIEHIDLIHLTHTDLGYTDHPVVCRELLRRYLDVALDYALATADLPDQERFYWTAEALITVDDWWRAAAPARRDDFVRAVHAGQIEVGALPMNLTPLLDRHQWNQLLHWLDDDLWEQLQPKVALQDDVNGFPRAGAAALLDREVGYLWMGINSCFGGAPRATPSAFWWRMPDGRRTFVWLGLTYNDAWPFFAEDWRQGPVPRAADTRFRPPRPGEILTDDEDTVREAHRRTLKKIEQLQAAGYAYPSIALSTTNQWRFDNDPPFGSWPRFVAAWNRLGLRPSLRLTTPSVALKRLEEAVGAELPQCDGEWTDWWVNGVASSPREVAVSRRAKRLLTAAESTLWGPIEERQCDAAGSIRKELCLFDEHTWGSLDSAADPDGPAALGHFNEKAGYAFRAEAKAEWLLGQRMRGKLAGTGEDGLYAVNTSKHKYTGWVELPVTCFREDYRSVEDPASDWRAPIHFEPGWKSWARPEGTEQLSATNLAAVFPDQFPDQVARFWVDDLPPASVRRLRLSTRSLAESDVAGSPSPTIERDETGWPGSITWPGMPRSLVLQGFGGLRSVEVHDFAPRWVLLDIWEQTDATESNRLRAEHLREIAAQPNAETTFHETPHTLHFSQALCHPRLAVARRQLEFWKRQPRARLTVELIRTSDDRPELLFVDCPLPCDGTPPETSNGGMAFVPFEDQIPGTCRDYFAIDEWIRYRTPRGNWWWTTRDAPLVSFGETGALARRQDRPAEAHRILAMVFNNFWFTNFVGNSHGLMRFQFDLAWQPTGEEPDDPAAFSESLLTEPRVLIEPGLPEDPVIARRIYQT